MRTIIKTNIKGNENLYIKEDIEKVFNLLIDKQAFILVSQQNYNEKTIGLLILRKSCIKMIRQQS